MIDAFLFWFSFSFTEHFFEMHLDCKKYAKRSSKQAYLIKLF